VPPLDAPVNTFRITPADGATQLTVRQDGTVQRDTIPAWRRFERLARL
jgi:hypothetical protein